MADLPQNVLDKMEELRQHRLNQRKLTYEEAEAQFRRNLEQRRFASSPCSWSNGLEHADDSPGQEPVVLRKLSLSQIRVACSTDKSTELPTTKKPVAS